MNDVSNLSSAEKRRLELTQHAGCEFWKKHHSESARLRSEGDPPVDDQALFEWLASADSAPIASCIVANPLFALLLMGDGESNLGQDWVTEYVRVGEV